MYVGVWWERRLARRAGPEPVSAPPSATYSVAAGRPIWVLALLVTGPEVSSVSHLACLAWKFSFVVDVN